MPQMIFAFLITLAALGAAVLMLMLIIQARNRSAKRRQEMFEKALEAGVYDRQLLGMKKRNGHAMLGWGIFFVAVGFGIMIALGATPDPFVFRNGVGGAVIPLFIGIAMIVFYFLAKKFSSKETTNGEPVVLEKDEGPGTSGVA